MRAGREDRWSMALIAGALVILMGLGFRLHPAWASAPAQELTPFPTPTPGPDGRILYIVQPGDTLWRVAAISGLTVDELRELNNLNPEETIVVGQTLLLGFAGPAMASPTPGLTATPTPLLPTPTPPPGKGTVCVLLYRDDNGNALYDEDLEPLVSGGAVSLNNREGSVSLTATTNDQDPVCFEDIPEGEYNLTMAVPTGYNPTTALNTPIRLQAGDTIYVSFGAQKAEAPADTAPEETSPARRSPLLGVVGGLLVLAGAGLWFFSRRYERQG